MRIYLSGRMTGVKHYNFPAFFEAQEKLEPNWDVVNPARIALDLSYNTSRELNEISRYEYLKEDIKALLQCESVYMLNKWKKSKGAKLEYKIAKALGMAIYYEKKPLADVLKAFIQDLKHILKNIVRKLFRFKKYIVIIVYTFILVKTIIMNAPIQKI